MNDIQQWLHDQDYDDDVMITLGNEKSSTGGQSLEKWIIREESTWSMEAISGEMRIQLLLVYRWPLNHLT